MSVSNQDSKVRLDGDGVTVDFDFSFKVFTQTDIEVYLIDTSVTPNTSVLQTLTTDYTVTLNTVSEGGTVTMVTAPANTDELLIVRVLEYTQPTEIPTESNIPETQLENTYDKNTMLVQQVKEITDRAAKVSQTSEAVVTLPDPEDGKTLVWDGTSGTMVNSTDTFNDIVTNATAAQTAAEAAQSAAEAAQSNAEDAETTAEEWATKIDGIVDATEYSSKAWAIGGTGVTETASRGASKEWATKTDAPVDTSEYSAKEYAQGTQAGTGGSAKDWAMETASDVDSTGSYSSKEWALGSQTRGTSGGGSAKDWANYVDGVNTVDDSEFSAKYWAQQAALATAPTVPATETITDTSTIAHDANYFQRRRVVGNAGAVTTSTTPFGATTTNFTDGMEIVLIGTDGTNTVTVPYSDTTSGALLNGDCTLGKGDSLTLIYDATQERFIEKCRNF